MFVAYANQKQTNCQTDYYYKETMYNKLIQTNIYFLCKIKCA
jgi:hypothetical protein